MSSLHCFCLFQFAQDSPDLGFSLSLSLQPEVDVFLAFFALFIIRTYTFVSTSHRNETFTPQSNQCALGETVQTYKDYPKREYDRCHHLSPFPSFIFYFLVNYSNIGIDGPPNCSDQKDCFLKRKFVLRLGINCLMMLGGNVTTDSSETSPSPRPHTCWSTQLF